MQKIKFTQSEVEFRKMVNATKQTIATCTDRQDWLEEARLDAEFIKIMTKELANDSRICTGDSTLHTKY
jgi:hypothetical protein